MLRTFRAAQRTELVDAEREILLPTIVGQLQFLRQLFVEVQNIARRPDVHTDLAHALAQVLPPPPKGMNPDESARAYFTEIIGQAQQLIDPVDEVLRDQPTEPNVITAWAWLSRGWAVASMVVNNRRLMFWKKLRGFATLRDANTQQITAFRLPQVDWIVFPFDTIVDEAARVAEAIQHNVDDWKAELTKSRQTLLEHSAARAAQSGARLVLWTQLAVTAFSVVLVVLGIQATDWFTKRQELEATRGRFEATTAELERARTENGELRARISELEHQLADIKRPPPAQPNPAPAKTKQRRSP